MWVITEGRSPKYRGSRTLKILCMSVCVCVCVCSVISAPRRRHAAAAPPPLSWRGIQTSVLYKCPNLPPQTAAGPVPPVQRTRRLISSLYHTATLAGLSSSPGADTRSAISRRADLHSDSHLAWLQASLAVRMKPPFFWVVTHGRTVVWCWRFGTSFCSHLHRSNISQIIYQ